MQCEDERLRIIIGIVFVIFQAILMVFSLTDGEEKNGFRTVESKMLLPSPTPLPSPSPTPTPHPMYAALSDSIDEGEITYTVIEYEYIGTYYITSYCPAECGGSWATASGETCHRADYDDRLYEPTTCAIDRRLHSFGDMFYIPEFDRVFVAEDTGSAVKGKHLDLFYEDYSDVLSFPTGYYEVYAVEYVTKTISAKEN